MMLSKIAWHMRMTFHLKVAEVQIFKIFLFKPEI